ncbi:penicillin acylase family protein [Agromyces archimandritae]|uniref:Penicillin acylase family protein n=1 Tax=Agromyces archimandritae TaxID=2781962 RepID=A0A975FQ32_9MICO|nr:penicillin acylase family protein [Agromyces archimandritae]
MLVGVIVGVLVLTVAAAGFGWWTVQRSFPATSGRMDLTGLDDSVTVYRDDAGIPQLVAKTEHDLFFAQGYVHAQDRFWEMDFRRHVTSGRLAELFGASQVDTDVFIRTLGWRQVAEREYEALDADSKAAFDAYADGVNSYLEGRNGADLSLEYAVLGLQLPGYSPEPWSPVDSVAWLKAMAWDLRSNLDDEIDRALLSTELPEEEVARLHPGFPSESAATIIEGTPAAAPAALSERALTGVGSDASADPLRRLSTVIDGLPELLGPAGGDIGSNSWVVSGIHTETGRPYLANDPHLGPAMPSIWTQMGLHCETVDANCRYDVAGYSFSGFPGIIIGHNSRISWGLTNLGPDVADLYLERVNEQGYELDGAVLPFKTREETIEVAGGDPVVVEVRATGRGPIVSDVGGDYARIVDGSEAAADGGEYALSLQWTALEPGRTAEAVFRINRAWDWDSFREGAAMFDVPSQNLVYADIHGHIGYQAPGRVPIRKQGDGTVPLPGWTSANGWSGYLAFEQLPNSFDPERGYIVTANNAVTTNGPFLTADWDLGYRATRISQRIDERIASGTQIDLDFMSEVQADTYDANAARFLPVLAGLDADGDAARGIRLLDGWDARADADSAEAAYFAVFWRTLLERMFAEKLPDGTQPVGGDRWFSVVGTLLDEPDSAWWSDEQAGIAGRDEMLLAALDDAWTETSERLGANPKRWQWGRLHTLTITNQSFGTSGIGPVEWMFNRGPYELGGGSAIVDAVGWNAREGYEVNWIPSMRMVVDLKNFDRSRWVNLTGASGHAFHPNYVDQAELWASGQTRVWPFSKGAVHDAATESLVLRPDPDAPRVTEPATSEPAAE